MRTEYDIILRPIITEKASIVRDEANAYVFEVRKDATKDEIKRAVEKAFDVKVRSVKTMIMPGKKRFYRNKWGQRPQWKKAVVMLEEGYQINIMEGI